MGDNLSDFQNRGKKLGKNARNLETKRRPSHIGGVGRRLRRACPVLGGRTMSLVEKIPTLSDAEVINLLTNARRLAEVGDERQQAAAAELLPALETAAEARKADRLASAQAKRAAARKPKKVAA